MQSMLTHLQFHHYGVKGKSFTFDCNYDNDEENECDIIDISVIR